MFSQLTPSQRQMPALLTGVVVELVPLTLMELTATQISSVLAGLTMILLIVMPASGLPRIGSVRRTPFW